MMKCVFVLVLLHLCVGAKSDTNLYMEIIDGLTKLEKYVTSVSVSISVLFFESSLGI